MTYTRNTCRAWTEPNARGKKQLIFIANKWDEIRVEFNWLNVFGTFCRKSEIITLSHCTAAVQTDSKRISTMTHTFAVEYFSSSVDDTNGAPYFTNNMYKQVWNSCSSLWSQIT